MLRARWSYALVPWQARRFLHLLRSLRRSFLRYFKRHTNKGKLPGWRAWALALVLFVGVFSLSGTAYAIDTEIIVGPNVVTYPNSNTTGQGYIVAADNVYAAAEPVLGIDYDGLTENEKALLSNESTGGAFYTFVNKFQTMTNGNYPSGGWVTSEFCGNLVAVYGNDYLYWIDFTVAEKTAAQISFALVKAGQVGGGGSGGGSSGSSEYVDVTCFAGVTSSTNSNTRITITGDNNTIYTNQPNYSNNVLPQNFILHIPKTILADKIYDDLLVYFVVSSSNIRIVFWDASNLQTTKSTYTLNSPSFVREYISSASFDNVAATSVLTFPNTSYTFDGSDLYLNTDSVLSFNNNVNLNPYTFQYWSVVGSTEYNSVVIPPTNWPTVPTNPTVDPPQVPNPDPPVTTPTYPTTNIYQDVTYVTADIAAILDALNVHCEHLQRSISDNFYDFWSVWSTQISDEFSHLEDYLHDLFVWLAAQFDFDSGAGYNDDTVVSWLKKIWLKLGTGGNSRPTDPVIDPFGWAEWLQQLLANFLDALLGLGTGAVDDVVDDLTSLLGKFPFCVPWDLAAALAILDAEPIVPEFEWPMFYLDASGLHSFEVELSMESYDEYMGGVRFMFKLIWIVVLLWKTKDAMELLKLGGASSA